MARIVTPTYITEALQRDETFVIHFIGRALAVLLNEQTNDEQIDATTKHTNFRGFSQSDAKSGTLTAKFYLKHKTLTPWQIKAWTKMWRGRPRIAKYWKQLDRAAQARREAE